MIVGYPVHSEGPHTWPIIHDYHKCEKCGTILESRKPFTYRMGEHVKDLSCSQCGHRFTLKKKGEAQLGPLCNSS